MELIKILNIKYLINNEQTNQTNLPADIGLSDVVACKMRRILPEWQSQYAVGLNKLAPHTYVWPYASATDVKKGGLWTVTLLSQPQR